MKLPHFPFYPSDWLGSPTVIAMTLEERGAYITLLACMWQTEDCTLPNDMPYLCRLLGNQLDESLVTNLVTRTMGVVDNIKITNFRLHQEHQNASKAYTSRVEAARKAREHKTLCDSLVTNLQPEPEPEPKPELQKDYKQPSVRKAAAYSDEFCEFWKEYPKKVGKGGAWRVWQKIGSPVENLASILLALEWQKKSEQWTRDNGQYVPHPATYLNQRRWEDEPLSVEQSKKYDYREFMGMEVAKDVTP